MVTSRCARCGEPASRTLGSEVLCPFHRNQILDPIRARVAARELAEAMRSVHADLLTPPPDADDDLLEEWGHRLSRAALSGLITHAQARDAWRRAVTDAEANAA